MPANITRQRERSQSKNLVSPFLVKYARSGKPPSSEGATVALALVVALAVIAGTSIVAQRSFDGLVGSVFQSRAKDARLTAEAGTAFIISEWNRPANRRLYTGLPTASWPAAKNRCTAPSPDFDIASAAELTDAATSFADGNEVTLPGGGSDFSRRFVLISAKFTPGTAGSRGTPFSVTGGNPGASTGTSPAISETNARGFLELVVEGRVYGAGNQSPVATSRITREFIIEPKCCTRSFGGVIINNPELGNDFRACPGQSDLPIGDLAIVTGVGGGGGLGENPSARSITDQNDTNLTSITCDRPPVSTNSTCVSEGGVSVKNGESISYEIKPISLPNPPLIAVARENFRNTCRLADPNDPSCNNILSGPGLTIDSATTINGDATNNENCHRGAYPPVSEEAYHCIVKEITLNGNGKTLNVNTTSRPVYVYLQQGAQDITIGGQGQINHLNNGLKAPLSLTNRFQIRGIPVPSNSACTSSQKFELFGNAIAAMFIWAPCANTTIRGTADFSGILWTNDLTLDGDSTTLKLAIPSNPGTCVTAPSAVPCRVLKDIGELEQNSKPIDWAARAINFTRFF